MPPRKRRFNALDDDDKFETEAFSFMNDSEKPNKKTNFDDDSDAELSGSDHSDVEEKLLKENEDNEANDSDDDAPDDIGFGDSRQSVLSQLRTAMKQMDSAKQKKKDKRKQLDAQFKEQKAKKLEELSRAKLPDDILEGLDEKIPKKKKKTKELKKKGQHATEDDILFDDMDDELEVGDHSSHPAGDLGDDFIALTDSASGVQVAELRGVDKKSKSLAQSAIDFRRDRLYGSHIKRESNKDRLAKAEKRKHRLR